jgi:hypothetical protein
LKRGIFVFGGINIFISIVEGFLPKDIIHAALELSHKIHFPMVPSEGLLLSNVTIAPNYKCLIHVSDVFVCLQSVLFEQFAHTISLNVSALLLSRSLCQVQLYYDEYF